MSTERTCNSSFWTREEDKIFENTLEIYFSDTNLLRKMEDALPGKSIDNIKDHYNILLEDIDAIESGSVPLLNHPEMQSDANENSKEDVKWRRGIPWTEEEHRAFLWLLDVYGKGEWRSISQHCVITRIASQVASHAQRFFKRVKANNKGNRRARAKASILDITCVDAEFAGTFQVPKTEAMIRPQAVPNTSNESMLPRESTNAEQMTTVVIGELSGQNIAFVNVDTRGSILPNKKPCIGSDLEALLSHPTDEDNDINSIFDVGKVPISDARIAPTPHTGMFDYAVAGEALTQLPPFAPSY